MSKRKGRSRQPRTSEVKSVMRGRGTAEGDGGSPESGPELGEVIPIISEEPAAAEALEERALDAPSSPPETPAEPEESDDVSHLRAVAPADATPSSDIDELGASDNALDADDPLLLDDEETSLPLPLDLDGDDTEAFISGLIEALLFTSQKPLALKDIARSAGVDRPRAQELLERLIQSYERRGLCIEEVAGGFVMRSSARYAPYIQKLLALRPIRLSRAQLETLAIIAYRQPVTKPEVDEIRGVDSGQVVKGLLERSLLKILGKKDEPGRPMLYGTTTEFLELLNLQSLKDLPTLREYTELSEESQRKFMDETGETAPGGAAAFVAAESLAASGRVEVYPEADGSLAEATTDAPPAPEGETMTEETASDDAPSDKHVMDDDDLDDDDLDVDLPEESRGRDVGERDLDSTDSDPSDAEAEVDESVPTEAAADVAERGEDDAEIAGGDEEADEDDVVEAAGDDGETDDKVEAAGDEDAETDDDETDEDDDEADEDDDE